ncbi:type VI secretion system tube protein Hcp [Pelagibius sp. Alg239-R121]|uniref:Hcp family type VI secretion system effector n=1 Tax=Pelagibius sp. Alg239-R121 TaxID=2993448 RepID=UPI0024A67114|nr:type VI secretion system tube protein Hcp [Pelagibius sp. Alg239-R121]
MAIYVKYEGIDGDATHQDHKKWIQVESMQWGTGRAIMTTTGSTTGREASEPSVSEVTFAKVLDSSSAHLFTEATTGVVGKKCEIHLVSTGSPGELYLTYELTNSLVSGYSVSSGGDRPSESVSVNFTKVEMKYTPFDENHKAGSPIPAGYDMTTTKKV